MKNLKVKNFFLTLVIWLLAGNSAYAFCDLVTTDKTTSKSTVQVGEFFTVYPKVTIENGDDEIRNKLDIVLTIDHSYSMFEYDDRMEDAKDASINFVNLLDNTYDHAALVRFSTNAELQKQLTADLQSIKDKISDYHHDSFSSFTDLEKAINTSVDELDSDRVQDDSIKVIVLLSDGGVNRPLNGGVEDKPYAKEKAKDAAENASDKGFVIYTITLGESNTDEDLLEDIANITGGHNYIAPDSGDLLEIYESIATSITNIAASNAVVKDYVNSNFILDIPSIAPAPFSVTSLPDGSYEIVWNLGTVEYGEVFNFSYKVKAKFTGDDQPVSIYPDARVILDLDTEEDDCSEPIPQVFVDVPQPKDNNDDDSDDNDKHDGPDNDEDGSEGKVLGLAIGGPIGEVLGLATTGNIVVVYGVASLGIVALATSVILYKSKRNKK